MHLMRANIIVNLILSFIVQFLKVGEIIGVKKGQTLEALGVSRIQLQLDSEYCKSAISQNILAAVGIIFTGGIGSTWAQFMICNKS